MVLHMPEGGALVKECRAIRPRLARTDSREDRRDKNEIIRSPHSAVCRSQADRLELRLALFGFEGTHYTLTYDSVHLPRTFREAMATSGPSWPGRDDSMKASPLTGLPAWRDCTETTATTST